MEKLFNKYPSIFYNETECLDLSRRVKINTSSQINPNLYYPFEIRAGLRADSLAEAYYDDPELDWLVYLSNEIIDPYYDWYLTEQEFIDFIVDKYGTIEYAIKKKIYYRNNWASDREEITPSFYSNNLDLDSKKFYSPNYGPGARIISYSRKKENWLCHTNEILQYEVDYTTGNSFSNGEILDIKYSGEIVGGGEVIVSNTTNLVIKHTSGNVVANSTWTKTLIGETSETEASTDSMTVLNEVITNAAANFWSPVSYYDWETEKNEQRKFLKIMDRRVSIEASNQLRLSLKTN